MSIEYLLQYGAAAVSLIALFFNRKGISKFIPVGMFAILYANIWCYIAIYFHLWTYPVRVFPFVQDINFIVNMVVVPITAMIWIKHIGHFFGKFMWAVLWTVGLTGVEFALERFTNVIKYHNGYDWYFSLILWFFTWFIWAGFHKWQIRSIIQQEKPV
jgi:hypothetical protein